MNIKLIIIAVIVILILILAFQNREIVEYKFFFWSFAISRILLLPLLLALGLISGYVLANIVGKKAKKIE